MDNKEQEERKPRIKPVIEAADSLSLGISMVVAVLMGVGIGWLLKSFTGETWTLWIGVFIGVGAAISNVYKAYAKQKKVLDELAKDPRYTYKKEQQEKYDAEEEDDKY